MGDVFSELSERISEPIIWNHSISRPPEPAEDLLPFLISIVGPCESVVSARSLEVLEELRSLGQTSKAPPGSPRWILFIEQRGRCAICNNKHDEVWKHGSLHVDHDHETGRIRGLLCMSCNITEARSNSYMKPEIVRYLQNPPARNRWLYGPESAAAPSQAVSTRSRRRAIAGRIDQNPPGAQSLAKSTHEMNPVLQYVRIDGDLRGNQKYKAHLAELLARLDGCSTFVVERVPDNVTNNFVIVGTESQARRVLSRLLPTVRQMQKGCTAAIAAHHPDKAEGKKRRFEYAWGYYFGFNQALEQRLKPAMKNTGTLTPPQGTLSAPKYDNAKLIEASISAGRRDGMLADLKVIPPHMSP